MRLAVYHNQPSGGARRALFGFCREFAQQHDVHVFTLGTSDQGLLRDDAIPGVRVHITPFAPHPPKRYRLYLNDVAQRRNLRTLEQTNAEIADRIDGLSFDVVLADVCRFTQAPMILRHLQTPTAYYCHEPPRRFYEHRWRPVLTPYERLRRAWHIPLERALDARLQREDIALVRSARRLFTTSLYSRRRIEEVYGRDSAVCPPGVELPPLEHATRGSFVLSVGAIEPHKGFELLIDAMALMPQASRPPLHIVANDGNQRLRSQLEARSAALNVELRILWRISDQDLRREYSTARAFVYGAFDEPLGLAPLEAMSHGTPVVAVAEGGVRETVVDGATGLLVSRETGVFAEALSGLVSRPDLAARMGAAGREHVATHWSWPVRAAALEAQLIQLANAEIPPAVPQ